MPRLLIVRMVLAATRARRGAPHLCRASALRRAKAAPTVRAESGGGLVWAPALGTEGPTAGCWGRRGRAPPLLRGVHQAALQFHAELGAHPPQLGDRAAQLAGDLRQAFRAQHDEREHQDQQQLARPDPEHFHQKLSATAWGAPAICSCQPVAVGSTSNTKPTSTATCGGYVPVGVERRWKAL